MTPSISEFLSSNNFSHHNFATLTALILLILIFIAFLSILIISIIFFIIYMLLNHIRHLSPNANLSNDLEFGWIFNRFRFIYNHNFQSRETFDETSTKKNKSIQIIDCLLPSIKYGGEEMKSKYEDCAICLEDYIKGDLCRIFPMCKHIFHSNCIDAWLENNSTCPICRECIFST
ncbi:hypothetical protein MANES_03G106016v8 [Manihot esculenta]|uniref:RING-type domain-containing protein n=1 Tax=Manihot esculenta TaxID=3983 RepID=A0A2C9W699_MANES|nr:hypothetical protein MANES_03G106016v8 [Manihot esculenta]